VVTSLDSRVALVGCHYQAMTSEDKEDFVVYNSDLSIECIV
jgi:hypothetical protein